MHASLASLSLSVVVCVCVSVMYLDVPLRSETRSNEENLKDDVYWRVHNS